jgi:flagellar basal body rod protein FlgC
MDYTALFEISGSGMDFQRLRLETIANNLAECINLWKPWLAVASSSSIPS